MPQALLRSWLKDKQEDTESSGRLRGKTPWTDKKKKITRKPGAQKLGLHVASAPPLPKVTFDGNELQGHSRPGSKEKNLVQKEDLTSTVGWSVSPHIVRVTPGQDHKGIGITGRTQVS